MRSRSARDRQPTYIVRLAARFPIVHTHRAQLQFEAVGDANRQAMVELPASDGPRPVGMLAAQLPIKRPGVVHAGAHV